MMQIDLQKVDLLIQCALLMAGEEDDYHDGELGPIHLLKYVYLADLAHAEGNQGQTYTGTPWKFHTFGPWSVEVHNRIEPALIHINATKNTLESEYEEEGEWYRWRLRDERKLEEIEYQLPLVVSSAIRHCVHQFGKDAPSLLDHVYRTPPMLSAHPAALEFYFSYASGTNTRRAATN